MKKKVILPIVLLLIALFALSLAACAPGSIDNVSVYTIRFNNNYDGTVVKQDVVAGDSFTLIADPTRDGYTFAGWYLDSEGETEQFTASSTLDGNVTVFAKWNKDNTKSIVTYKYRNFTTADTQTVVNTGSAVAKPANPKYDENDVYTFTDWYTDEACTNAYDFAGTVNSDITLYAGWTKAKAEVKFDANYVGCGAAAVGYATLGGAVERPADPERARYEFGDWYTERIGGDVYDFSATVEDDFTLYAHWIRSEYTVMFDLNGGTAEDVELSYSIKRNASAEEAASAIEAKLSYPGHVFAGWYKIKTDPDAEIDITDENDIANLSAVNDDMRVYAKWALAEYTVTFDYNYSGAPTAPAAQKVKFGKTLTEPQVATRNGYMFVGWYTEAAGTTQFTFDMVVTSDMMLYAKWIDSAQAGDATVTFYYIVNGNSNKISEAKVSVGTTAESKMPAEPTAADHIFGGWYTDAQFTKAFNPKAAVLEDMSVYGKMLKKYTFEAEAVNLEGKKGQGTSTNSEEEGMLMSASFIKGGDVSNGYFIREMYYNGAFIEFEIDAAEDTDDAVIYLRVSSESYEFVTTKEKDGKVYNFLSSDEYQIAVNGQMEYDPDTNSSKLISGFLKYDGLYMPMANLVEKEDLSLEKTPFENCFIAANVHLNKGTNYITLYVNNNNNHGGTFHAEAPIIDCMYIYSSVELSMFDYEYYTRPKVNRG